MLNKSIKFLIENKLVSVLLLLLFLGWGTVNAPFNWETGFLPNDPVAVDAIPDGTASRAQHVHSDDQLLVHAVQCDHAGGTGEAGSADMGRSDHLDAGSGVCTDRDPDRRTHPPSPVARSIPSGGSRHAGGHGDRVAATRTWTASRHGPADRHRLACPLSLRPSLRASGRGPRPTGRTPCVRPMCPAACPGRSGCG